ncbi:TIGR03013 family XrtA/PEP-CTERM system glycosyltransferase [Aliikangiella coralliicola]|uniref:TIGR03013 family PEP-CTERM/XrtA system glycosyltransferase n=1 Tax=Aliikangiella coralliicola TaxID=2592383 RepID=A0A545UHC6_9GAMM|nr:TIGR03013 family XrtA/PEP-CTERM system glycosyltransferase [Aliikangiella coralliicola]TQV88876.1 TIGR03013 family PEP-CTERM/XrtA system glycosyltransferase [Aliikangiella coralliicola]
MATVKIFNHHFRVPYVFLILIELSFLFGSVYAGSYLRFSELLWQPTAEELQFFPLRGAIYAIIMLFAMVAMGQYQTPGPRGKYYLPSIVVRVLISLTLGGLALAVVYYVFPNIVLGRGILAYTLLTSFIGLVLIRLIFFQTVDGRSLRRKVLVLGAGDLASHLLDKTDPVRILAPKNASYVIHGFVDFPDDQHSISEQYLVSPGDNLAEYCEAYEIDEIVLAISDRRKTLPVDALLDCKLSNINVIDFVSFWEREKGMLRLDMLNPSWMIFADGCKQSSFGLSIRRIFDIAISFVILAMMFPVLIVTAILIFIESGFKGPIFYSQIRVGLNGKPFKLLKFRSMVVNAEKDGAQWAKQNDMRVTRIGKFIRKVRIDELPQMLNILRGDMSIVGPRPERPEFVEQLDNKVPFYSARHRVKPGLAGWAQLKYPYGASEDDAYNKLQYDLYYVKNHSFLMDVLVLLQTVEVIILGKGAR